MEKKLILRGVIAGAIGGLLAFVFARIFAESQIQAAIDYESGRDDAQMLLDKATGLTVEEMGPDIFSRTIQANIGIGVGSVAGEAEEMARVVHEFVHVSVAAEDGGGALVDADEVVDQQRQEHGARQPEHGLGRRQYHGDRDGRGCGDAAH